MLAIYGTCGSDWQTGWRKSANFGPLDRAMFDKAVFEIKDFLIIWYCFLSIEVFYTSKTTLLHIIQAFITALEICDYTVCDVTNPKWQL